MIGEGSFKARGVSASFGKSNTKGTPCVTVTLRLEDGPDKGQLIDWVGWLTDSTKARTAESLALLGFDGSDLKTCGANEIVVVIEHEEYTTEAGEVKQTARVRWINDPARGGSRMQAVTPVEQAAMLADIRGLVLSAKKPVQNQTITTPSGVKF